MKHPRANQFCWWWGAHNWDEYGRQDEIAASTHREAYMLTWEQGVAGWRKT